MTPVVENGPCGDLAGGSACASQLSGELQQACGVVMENLAHRARVGRQPPHGRQPLEPDASVSLAQGVGAVAGPQQPVLMAIQETAGMVLMASVPPPPECEPRSHSRARSFMSRKGVEPPSSQLVPWPFIIGQVGIAVSGAFGGSRARAPTRKGDQPRIPHQHMAVGVSPWKR